MLFRTNILRTAGPMLEIDFRFAALLAPLGDGGLWVESTSVPEYALCERNLAEAKRRIAKAARRALRELKPGDVHRRRINEPPTIGHIDLTITPPKPSVSWREGLLVRFFYARWTHRDEAALAYVPALGTTILAPTAAELDKTLESEIRLAVDRAKPTLQHIAHWRRFEGLSVAPLQTKVKLPTERERTLAEEAAESVKKSTLETVGQRAGGDSFLRTYERDDLVAQVAETLFGKPPRSVLLVGASGVGKTGIFHELARRRTGAGAPPIWTTSGSQIIAGALGYGMWQQRCQKLVREASETGAVVHVGELFELIEVGKGGGSAQGVASFLRPSLQRGQWLAVAECAPERLGWIEQSEPRLLEAFHVIEVDEPNADRVRSILLGVAAEGDQADAPDIAALDLVDSLHRRFARYSAAPGRSTRFLRDLMRDRRQRRDDALRGRARDADGADTSAVLESRGVRVDDVFAAFTRETGLPRWMLDPATPIDLEQTRAWFADRVKGQPEPLRNLVDVVAVIKSGLQRGGKPIASLLFAGPTGVGKTETAKALAEFLYGDVERMIRIDMSEFSDAWSASRLVGGPFGSEGLLTKKLRDRPYSVVLLDEFEKAHPAVFDLLLQALGEGRLTDGAGRVADFSSAVVVMTSNLGADTFRRAGLGFGELDARRIEDHFVREVQRFVRPEFFNRIDRVVPFAPLDRASIEAIARREVDKVLRREGMRRRPIQITVDDTVVSKLAERGYDPRYGARPLRREVERSLVAPLAAAINQFDAKASLRIQVALGDDVQRIKVDVVADPRLPPIHGVAERDLDTLVEIEAIRSTRRRATLLERSSLALRLRNQAAQVEQTIRERRLRKKREQAERERAGETAPQWSGYDANDALLETLRRDLTEIDTLAADARGLEDRHLVPLYRGATATFDQSAEMTRSRAALDERLRATLRKHYATEVSSHSVVTLVIFGAHWDWVRELADGMVEAAQAIEQSFGRVLPTPRWRLLATMGNVTASDDSGAGETPNATAKPSKRKTKLSRPSESEELSQPGSGGVSNPSGDEAGDWKDSFYLTRRVAGDRVERVLRAFGVPNESRWDKTLPPRTFGVAVTLVAKEAALQLANESGTHLSVVKGVPRFALVDVHQNHLIDYSPPTDLTASRAFVSFRHRRKYDFDGELATDFQTGESRPMKRLELVKTILEASAKDLERQIWEQIL